MNRRSLVENNNYELDNLEIAIVFYPTDAIALELLKQNFVDEEILETNSFSGEWIYTIITSISKHITDKLAGFLSQNKHQFKDIKLKIGKEEISLSGYSMEEVKDFFDSKPVQNALQSLKKR